MTVQTNNNSISYVGNGSTVHFDYDYLILDASHLKIYFGGVLQTSGYVVSGVSSQTGGTVAFAVAPPDGTNITLIREVPFLQLTDYQPYDAFPVESHERALDLLTMMTQQLKDGLGRAMQRPVGGNKWDARGSEIVNVAEGQLDSSASNVGQVKSLIAALAGPDSAAQLRVDLAAAGGADLVGLPNGTVGEAIRFVTPEMFRLAGDADDTDSWVRAIDYATTNGVNIEGHGRYTVSGTLLIKQIASIPAVSRDFTRITVDINYMKFTGTGACIINRSPAVMLRIGELEGVTAFTTVDQTIGLQLSDNNQPLHQIGFIHGFATNIKFQDAYGMSVWLGHCDDALRGVRGDNSNACRVYGHVGGQFTLAAVDVTTCLVGVEWTDTCAANEVYAVVEYCRRTSAAKAFIDNGASNKYYGYSESCAAQSSIDGKYCEYDLFNGGDNVRSSTAYLAGGLYNIIKLLKANVTSGLPAVPTNNALTFKNIQPVQSITPQSLVHGPGLREILGAGKTAQLVKWSNDLTNAAWTDSYDGGLTGGSKAFGKYGQGETSRYIYGTRFTFADAAANENQFYRIQQTLTSISFTSQVSLGMAVRCISGNVDVFIKLQGLTSSKVYTVEHRLIAGSKTVELWHSCPSTYGSPENYVVEIQFRPWSASTVIDVYNAHVCASPNVRRAPVSIAGNITNFVQRVDEDTGINVRHSVAPSSIISYPLSLYQYDFDTYIMPNVSGNVTLAGDGYDGQRVTFKKLGGAAANILCAKLIDGVSSYPMTTANSAVTLMFSAELDTWLVLSKV